MKYIITSLFILIVGTSFGQRVVRYDSVELRYPVLSEEAILDSSKMTETKHIDTTYGFVVSKDHSGGFNLYPIVRITRYTRVTIPFKIGWGFVLGNGNEEAPQYFQPPNNCETNLVEYKLEKDEHFVTQKPWCEVFLFGKN